MSSAMVDFSCPCQDSESRKITKSIHSAVQSVDHTQETPSGRAISTSRSTSDWTIGLILLKIDTSHWLNLSDMKLQLGESYLSLA